MTQVPPPQQPPLGYVDLTVQGSHMTSNIVVPKAWINGYPVRVQYGLNTVPVPAGPVRVDLNNQWMRTYGQASIEFPLHPGQRVPVFYAAPAHQFTTGSIGHQQVARKGWGALVVMLTVLIGLPLTLLILAAVLA